MVREANTACLDTSLGIVAITTKLGKSIHMPWSCVEYAMPAIAVIASTEPEAASAPAKQATEPVGKTRKIVR